MGGKAGRRSSRTQPPTPDFESWTRYGAAVIDLATRLGWNPKELWGYFWFFTLMCFYELRVPLEVAEDSAWRLLRGCVEKQGVHAS